MKPRNELISVIRNEDKGPIRIRMYIATPTLGIIRAEWAQCRWGAVTPCNWSNSGSFYSYVQSFPMGYLVADAQNVAVMDALRSKAEWLFLLEDDVLIPPDTFLRLNQHMREAKTPVISGLYFAKGNFPEPLIYKGRGNSCFTDWKRGNMVWADGVPTGCLLIHTSLLQLMSDESPEYMTCFGKKVKKVFETPAKSWTDPETGGMKLASGTSDLYWCDRVIRDKVLQRSGWKNIAKRKYPFLVDTNIFCKHIDLQSGKTYPLGAK